MSAEEHDTDTWPSDPDYLRDVADRIFSIPVMYGLDEGDAEHLREIADRLSKLEHKREECSIDSDQGEDPDDNDPGGDGLPVFPDIGCKHQHDGSDGCGFVEAGVGFKCREGEACGRYIGPREPRFDAIKRYHLAMTGSNS